MIERAHQHEWTKAYRSDRGIAVQHCVTCGDVRRGLDVPESERIELARIERVSVDSVEAVLRRGR